VKITTAKGSIEISVDGALSPIAAGNFVALASCGFYNGVVFHRLVPGFVIQGGDPTGTGTGGPGYEIQDEPVTAEYHRGVVAMARTQAPNSQGSQFFIVLSDAAARSLVIANSYAIFGEVTSGMETVDAIAAMPNSGEASGNAAIQPVAMDSVTVSQP
jgi:cyclophilin family peptidyl-prolyl cis-trans isomerase